MKMKVIEGGMGTGRTPQGRVPAALSQMVGWDALPWEAHASDRADFVREQGREQDAAAVVPEAQNHPPAPTAESASAPDSAD